MHVRLRIALLAALAGCNDAQKTAADAAPPAPPAVVVDAAASDAGAKPSRLVLHAARALVPRTGTIIAPAWIEIENSSIVRTGTTPPADPTNVTELGDVTLMPGMIDAHTHLLISTVPDDDGSIVTEAVMMSDADRALRGVSFGRQMLASGFTTVRDLGNSGRAGDIALKRAIKMGWVVGPTMIVSTRALAPPGAQFPHLAPHHLPLIEQEYAIVASVDDARAQARRALAEGADCIKLIVDQGPARTMSVDEVRAAVDVAHAAGKKVAAHVLTEKAAEIAVAAGVDSCEHAYSVADKTFDEMAKKGTYLVPTDYPMNYYEAFAPKGAGREEALASLKKQHDDDVERLKRAKKHRVRIVFGSDAYARTDLADRGKEAALVFKAYAEAGFSPLEIVQTATSNAADLLGLPATQMALDAGSVADVIAVRGDPTKDVEALQHVVFVAKRGKVVVP